MRIAIVTAVIVTAALGASACKKKASSSECDALLDHFAELVVKERFPDAGAEVVAKERAREREEAKAADELKNCTSEVTTAEHACAMKAATSEAVIKCLE